MKSTGIVRKVDELGRVVLPIELRRNMGIEIKDSLEIFVEENTIILKKYEPPIFSQAAWMTSLITKAKKYPNSPFWKWQNWLGWMYAETFHNLTDKKSWNGMENTHHSGFFCFAQKFETGLSFFCEKP